MLIFARSELANRELPSDTDALLLEGSWSDRFGARKSLTTAGALASLDELIDAKDAWIDRKAHQLATTAIGDARFAPISEATAGNSLRINFADLFCLKLQYALVKWLRIIAHFSSQAPCKSATLFVETASHPADFEYELLLKQIAHRKGIELAIKDGPGNSARRLPERSSREANAPNTQRKRGWRSRMERLADILRPRNARQLRVMFFGNPRILDPVCAEFVRRKFQPVWLRDQFAPRSWLKWRWHGGEQVVIGGGSTSQTGHTSDVEMLVEQEVCAATNSPYIVRGVDLGPCIKAFLALQLNDRAAGFIHIQARAEQVIKGLSPACCVVDEDATPAKRLVVSACRRANIPTFVIQHGVPRLQFGFAPLAANAILCWGESSRRRLVDFGIPSDRVAVTGRADMPESIHRKRRRNDRHGLRSGKPSRLKVLLIGTTPPRDDRPEPVEFHLTTYEHRELLRNVCAALAEYPRVQLTIKRHPRCRDDGCYRELANLAPHLQLRIVQHSDLIQLALASDFVLNIASGGGIDAAAAGARVIELIPQGGRELLPASDWGMHGAAATAAEVKSLIDTLLESTANSRVHPQEKVFEKLGREAARKAVNEILVRTQEAQGNQGAQGNSAELPPARAVELHLQEASTDQTRKVA